MIKSRILAGKKSTKNKKGKAHLEFVIFVDDYYKFEWISHIIKSDFAVYKKEWRDNTNEISTIK